MDDGKDCPSKGVAMKSMQQFISNANWAGPDLDSTIRSEVGVYPACGQGSVLIIDESADGKQLSMPALNLIVFCTFSEDVDLPPHHLIELRRHLTYRFRWQDGPPRQLTDEVDNPAHICRYGT